MSRSSPRISQAELDVLDVLWTEAPLAASEVSARLKQSRDWSLQTVKTLLARLVDKDAVTTRKDGRRFLYSPLLSREEYARRATRRLSERLFGGRAAPLVAHLAEETGLSDTDLDELENLIADLKSQSSGAGESS